MMDMNACRRGEMQLNVKRSAIMNETFRLVVVERPRDNLFPVVTRYIAVSPPSVLPLFNWLKKNFLDLFFFYISR